MASVESQDTAVVPTQQPSGPPGNTLPGLLTELQLLIFKNCSQSDLICLMLTTRHVRDAAAAILYRSFGIVFPDDDDPSYDSPLDSLAIGLNTFVTSEYNYCRHIREICLDTLSTGDKAERAYKPYLFRQSCGKFLSTLMQLTLRKTSTLETFTWNIRVELSRSVYKELHNIDSLKHLHIRMQAGPSLYEIPPPLPIDAAAPTTQHSLPPANLWHAGSGLPPHLGASANYSPPVPPHISSVAKAFGLKTKPKSPLVAEPPTLSGFEKLQSVAILDIDNLEVITELKAVIRKSSLTLSKLSLSFSTRLALEARNPAVKSVVEMDDDMGGDDDFGAIPPIQASAPQWEDPAPVKAFRAKEERKVQEGVLARVFDLEPFLMTQFPVSAPEAVPAPDAVVEALAAPESTNSASTPAKEFAESIKKLSRDLLEDDDAVLLLDDNKKKEVYSNVVRAVEKYLESDEAKASPGEPSTGTEEASTAAEAATTKIPVTSLKTGEKDANPDDINIEEPIGNDEGDIADAQAGPEQEVPPSPLDTSLATSASPTDVIRAAPSPEMAKATATFELQRENFKRGINYLTQLEKEATTHRNTLLDMQANDNDLNVPEIAKVQKNLRDVVSKIETAHAELVTVRKEMQDAASQIGEHASKEEEQYAQICHYIRTTRGLPLKSFSVCLIPLRASVLKSAVDLGVLQKLTLLNVGSQSSIWAMIGRENDKTPLPLRKVSTDHVSKHLLMCLSKLQVIEELFMIERGPGYKPECFAPKTTMTIEHIRRSVLRKHLPSMKRLMIKNDLDMGWDADEKTVMMLCHRGINLEELSFSMGVRGVHILNQNIHHLKNLVALNVAHFRTNDTCPWVTGEVRRFIHDVLAHHLDLKLEWVAIDAESLMHIVRHEKDAKAEAEADKEKQKNKSEKGKAKVPYFMNSPSRADDWLGDESDDDTLNLKKLEIDETVRFHEVWGVRIFKKEVMAGRL